MYRMIIWKTGSGGRGEELKKEKEKVTTPHAGGLCGYICQWRNCHVVQSAKNTQRYFAEKKVNFHIVILKNLGAQDQELEKSQSKAGKGKEKGKAKDRLTEEKS